MLWRPSVFFKITNGNKLYSTVTRCCFYIRFEERRRGLGWRIASSPGALLPPFLRREPGDEARWRIREREKEERKGGGEMRRELWY